MRVRFVILINLTFLTQFSYFSCNIAFADTIKVASKLFNESYSNSVNINGNSLQLGVMYSSYLQKADPSLLYVDIKQSITVIDTFLCVTISSIDGFYSASFNLPIAKELTGLNRFILPSKVTNKLKKYQPQHLAIAAKLSSNCKTKIGSVVIASWGKPDKSKISIFINSGGLRSTLKLYDNTDTIHRLKCDEITTKRAIAYDHICLIKEPNNYKLKDTKIIRSRGIKVTPTINIPITTNI